MLTSESNNRDFHRYFDEHRDELAKRLSGLLLNKHRRTILALLKKGAEIPPIWGMFAYSGRYPFTNSGDIRSVRW